MEIVHVHSKALLRHRGDLIYINFESPKLSLEMRLPGILGDQMESLLAGALPQIYGVGGNPHRAGLAPSDVFSFLLRFQ